MEKAYRYRLYPTPEQEPLLRRTLGCVRLVYNQALAERTQAWYEHQRPVGYSETSSWLTQWKKQPELDFLNQVSSVPLQQTLRHLQKGFNNFFASRAKYPNFKKKRNGGSAEFTKSAFRWKDGEVWLAKCTQALPIRWSRMLPRGAEPSTITVKLDAAGRWFVSLLVDDPTVEALPQAQKSVGLDAGITSLVTTSDGEKIVNPKHFNRLYRKLRWVQKALSRKVKGSSNRERARVEVARVQAQIADARKDFLHKLTTRLVRENQTLVVEDLAVRNMVKNRRLARSISDAGWSELVRQLTYKCQWYGRTLVKVDRWFPSSKRCGSCGHIVERLPLSVREWTCAVCNTIHDRDTNAARNLLAVGHTVTACGAGVRPEDKHSRKAAAMKHENSEVILGILIL